MMTLPAWAGFMAPVLRVLEDGEVRHVRKIYLRVANEMAIPDELRKETLQAGDLKYENRAGWAMSYLNRVGALERPTRGHYRITETGRDLLTQHPEGLVEADIRPLVREGDEWWVRKSGTGVQGSSMPDDTSTELDPTEQVEQGIARIHADVASDLLQRLYSHEPAFFEQAVLDLLMAMGYGGAEGKATRTQLSSDGGIDGVVDQDALGLSRIYVQAKRYALDSSVGRPEIQAFVGALHGNQANQGVFLTTGRFSSGARQYAETIGTRVILIDGERLAGLMIRYGVGVQTKRTVHIVEVDEDFFE